MALAPGTRLGPYEIIGALGAGGMGEVYKARDTRLERIVAIKVLPATLAADPEFKARFEREARSISALNHPHICTLYDVGRLRVSDASASQGGDEISFLVLEHLDGETLADRLKKGPLPVDQALELASQIADALDKAHRQGIVHRDLKPANVFLVRAVGASGALHCKLLDFGLAKMGAAVTPGSLETRMLTGVSPAAGGAQNQTAPLTSQGSILGTFQYMAPEQIEGAEVDARTDIWAFGCVLHETLTGKRAFEGKSQASLMASILERQPTPMAELQPMTPPALGRLVRTCLEKSPDNRFHTAHDLWLHLQWIEEGGSQAGLPAPVVATRRRRDRLMFVGGAIGLAALVGIGAWALKPVPPPPASVITRFSLPLPDTQVFTRPGRRVVAISPDGTRIAYIANKQIYLRRMNELEAQPIRGTDVDPLDLFFSPHGDSVAFFVPKGDSDSGSLKKVPISGGKPVPLGDLWQPYGAEWQGDTIVVSTGKRIVSIPDVGGGKPTELATPEPGTLLAQPQLVGDESKYLLFTVRSSSTFDDAKIVVQPLAGGPRRVLIDGGTDGRILPTGHLIWTHKDTLYAQPIDPHTLQLRGGQVVLVEGVRQSGQSGAGQYAIAENGTLVYQPGSGEENCDLVWVDRAGKVEPTGAPPKPYTYPRLSPDGTKVVANTSDSDSDIWIYDLVRKTSPMRLTSGPDEEAYPVWTRDGRSVIYGSAPVAIGPGLVLRRPADGTGTPEKLSDGKERLAPQMVLLDGGVLARKMRDMRESRGTLVRLPPGGGAAEPVFPSTMPLQANAEVSPDGHWIVYESTEGSSRSEIHVRPYPKTDSGQWQISTNGGSRPLWSRSGRELFYVAFVPGRIMRVDVQPSRPDGAFAWGTPQELLSLIHFKVGAFGRAWDISLDDKRFLMLRSVGVDTAPHDSLTVVTHWFDELRTTVKVK